MNRKTLLRVLVVGLVLIASVSAVYARQDEEECTPKPTSKLGVSAITEGISFILAGGLGPILILVIVIIIGMVISKIAFGGF